MPSCSWSSKEKVGNPEWKLCWWWDTRQIGSQTKSKRGGCRGEQTGAWDDSTRQGIAAWVTARSMVLVSFPILPGQPRESYGPMSSKPSKWFNPGKSVFRHHQTRKGPGQGPERTGSGHFREGWNENWAGTGLGNPWTPGDTFEAGVKDGIWQYKLPNDLEQVQIF